jgi:hypothetical protein
MAGWNRNKVNIHIYPASLEVVLLFHSRQHVNQRKLGGVDRDLLRKANIGSIGDRDPVLPGPLDGSGRR